MKHEFKTAKVWALSLCVAVSFALGKSAQADDVDKSSKAKGEPAVSGLHDLEATLHHLNGALKGLLYESQRQDMVVVGGPDVIGNMVIPAIPDSSGMLSMGYLPPRKSWIDFLMNQVNKLVPILQTELAGIPQPQTESQELKEAYGKLAGYSAALGTNSQQLNAVTAAPPYSNKDIALKTSVLYYQVDELNKLRRNIYHLVKREEKEAEKDQKADKSDKQVPPIND